MFFELKNKARVLQNGKTYVLVILLFFFALAVFLFSVGSTLMLFALEEKGCSSVLLKVLLCVPLSLFESAVFYALKNGMIYYYSLKAGGKSADVKDLFFYFSPAKFFRSARFGFFSWIIEAVNFAVSFLPAFAFTAVLFYHLIKGCTKELFIILVLSAAASFAVSAFFYFKVRRLFFLAKYYFVKNEKNTAAGCFKQSAQMMGGQTVRLFSLRAGFAGWFLLCPLVFSVPFVAGYYGQTMALYAEKLIS
ncbi:MAG: hypothetical protein ACI4W6_02965 [Acutalibacteraceae bacterium]